MENRALDISALKSRVEKKRVIEMWGVTYEGNDVLCDDILGDGRQLLRITTMLGRPFCYYILVDSSLTEELLAEREVRDEIVQALEERYGEPESMREAFVENGGDPDAYETEFPVVDTSDGYMWEFVNGALEQLSEEAINVREN
jgi:hypothetical protein